MGQLDTSALGDDELAWLAPEHSATPAQALKRIETICRLQPQLFGAVSILAATHGHVRIQHLAAAIGRFHAGAAGLSERDISGLITATRTGSREAFDAVMRSRNRAQRGGGGAPAWLGGGDG
jgi:hypothetical protein